MEITEVRIKLMEDNSGSNERLQAFCSITFDDMFVIRDLKIIEGAKGFFVAMPSRKLTDRCHNCGTKNHLRSRFCNQCGCRLDENRASPRRGRPGQAARRHRPPHQLDVPGEDPVGRAGLLRRRARTGQDARLHLAVRRLRSRRLRGSVRQPRPGGARVGRRAPDPPRPVAGSHPACTRQPVGASGTARSAPAGQLGTGNRLGLSSSRRVLVVRQWHLSLAGKVASRYAFLIDRSYSPLASALRSPPISSRPAPARGRHGEFPPVSTPGRVRCAAVSTAALDPAFLRLHRTARRPVVRNSGTLRYAVVSDTV